MENLSGFERIDLFALSGNDVVDASGLTNPVSLNIDGGDGNDTIDGSANADTISGGAGNDTVDGNDGNDDLFGNAGNDTLNGGAGVDNLTGGAGDDRFVYDSVLDSGIFANRDIIQGFDFGTTATTGDKIDLSTIDADFTSVGNQAFDFIGTLPFTAPGQVGVFNDAGNTIVRLNTVGNLFAESWIQVNDGATVAADWEASDFIL